MTAPEQKKKNVNGTDLPIAVEGVFQIASDYKLVVGISFTLTVVPEMADKVLSLSEQVAVFVDGIRNHKVFPVSNNQEV